MIAPILYILCALCLLIYSYGFLDFNLTLSSNPIFLGFVAPLQHLVYFARHASAQVYGGIFLFLFGVYILLMRQSSKLHLTKFPWRLVLVLVTILTLAYPMLSYDLFNYMFHGKILWFYHANPHVHAPLEYTGDLWLRFMRWVHTPSAYGPVFTAIESPAYLLGLGKFVPVLYLMKATMAGFFVWCIYLVGQIATQLRYSREQVVLMQLHLALNPFLLFELVINGHNDAVMIAFLLLALYYANQEKKIKSIVALVASVGIKYMTVLSSVALLFRNPKHRILVATVALLMPVILSPGRFQPWYLTWAIIPAVLINTTWSKLWIYLASLAGLGYYIPYIYTGFWNNSLPFVAVVLYIPVVTSGSIWFINKLWMRTMLGERVITKISKQEKPLNFIDNKQVAVRGSAVAGNARKNAEREIGKSVISKSNYLSVPKKLKNPL